MWEVGLGLEEVGWVGECFLRDGEGVEEPEEEGVEEGER